MPCAAAFNSGEEEVVWLIADDDEHSEKNKQGEEEAADDEVKNGRNGPIGTLVMFDRPQPLGCSISNGVLLTEGAYLSLQNRWCMRCAFR